MKNRFNTDMLSICIKITLIVQIPNCCCWITFGVLMMYESIFLFKSGIIWNDKNYCWQSWEEKIIFKFFQRNVCTSAMFFSHLELLRVFILPSYPGFLHYLGFLERFHLLLGLNVQFFNHLSPVRISKWGIYSFEWKLL